MLTYNLLTIFPHIFDSYLNESISKRAVAKDLIKINVYNIRDYATDKHHVTDDTPYGGGPGMVMKVEPIFRCLNALPLSDKKGGLGGEFKQKAHTVLTSARGKQFTQRDAKRLASYNTITIICGRYEGVDQRVADHLCDEEFSIGPYVLSGGEIAALAILESTARLLPGVLGNDESLKEESHNQVGTREGPQYTKPEDFQGWKVPKVLLSGNHAEINRWRQA